MTPRNAVQVALPGRGRPIHNGTLRDTLGSGPERVVREQLDWERIRSATADNDYAVAFVVLVERLGLTGR
jgi:hypothetical protein